MCRFKLSHIDIRIWWCTDGSHCATFYLEIIDAVEMKWLRVNIRKRNLIITFAAIGLPVWAFSFSSSNGPKVFLGKGDLKIWCKFKGEHPCRSVISIKLLRSFIEIALRHRCSPVNFLHISRTSFSKNTFGWLLLFFLHCFFTFMVRNIGI